MFTFGAKDDAAGLTTIHKADANVFMTMSPMNPDLTQTPAYLRS
jgi:hypothetical protein